MDPIEGITRAAKICNKEIKKPNALTKIIEFNGAISDESFIKSELSQKAVYIIMSKLKKATKKLITFKIKTDVSATKELEQKLSV